MSYFKSESHFDEFKEAWAKLSNTKNATAADHMLYNIFTDRDPLTGFTPMCNPGRINASYAGVTNGAWEAATRISFIIKFNKLRNSVFDRFDGTVTYDMIDAIVLPAVHMLSTQDVIGRAVRDHISSQGLKLNTFAELDELVANFTDT